MATTIHYATNRAPIGNGSAAPYYSLDADPAALDRLHTGVAEVTTNPSPEANRPILSVVQDAAAPRPGRGVPPALAAWAQAAIDHHQDALVFIHGYGNTWADSIQRAAQLRDFYATPEGNSALPMAVLAFGWPSDGLVAPQHYAPDRKDAADAGPAMAAMLAQVAKLAPGIREKGLKLNLIAHSMGNWALRHGLAKYQPGATAPLFDQVVLAAADEDDDALVNQTKLGRLTALGQRITVYTYRFDVILMISTDINGNGRLGKQWPVQLPAPAAGRDDAALRVGPVLTELTDPNLTTHQYYRNNLEVRRDIIAVLEGRPQDVIRGRRVEADDARQYSLFGATAGGTPMV